MGDLQRFVDAQKGVYERALEEVHRGRKSSHWMWFIFPQLKGLGFSAMAQQYGLQNLAEAEAYLKHPVLGDRLVQISEMLLRGKCRDAHLIFGAPDDLKLHSCVTLFSLVLGANLVFKRITEEFFRGKPDAKTLQLLQ